jgi:hypothetical protein
MDAHLSAIVQYAPFGRINGTFQPGLQYGRFWMMLRHPVLKYIEWLTGLGVGAGSSDIVVGCWGGCWAGPHHSGALVLVFVIIG